MWSYIKIPYVDPLGNSGFVCLESYEVREGELIKYGDTIATARTEDRSFRIVSNYDGMILELMLSPGTLIGFRDPIGTLELRQDPVNGLPIERCELNSPDV